MATGRRARLMTAIAHAAFETSAMSPLVAPEVKIAIASAGPAIVTTAANPLELLALDPDRSAIPDDERRRRQEHDDDGDGGRQRARPPQEIRHRPPDLHRILHRRRGATGRRSGDRELHQDEA